MNFEELQKIECVRSSACNINLDGASGECRGVFVLGRRTADEVRCQIPCGETILQIHSEFLSDLETFTACVTLPSTRPRSYACSSRLGKMPMKTCMLSCAKRTMKKTSREETATTARRVHVTLPEAACGSGRQRTRKRYTATSEYLRHIRTSISRTLSDEAREFNSPATPNKCFCQNKLLC